MTIARRPETPVDEPFLRRTIVDSVALELMAHAWPEAMREHLLGMQYTARLASLRAHHPQASSEIIVADGEPCGWILLDELPDRIHLTEFLVTVGMRGKGIGTAVLLEVLREADGKSKPVHLSVNATNSAAIRLYERLGFACAGGDEMQRQMARGVGGPNG